MLHPGRIVRALEERRDAMWRAAEDSVRLQQRYAGALDDLALLNSAQIEERFGGVCWPGARPTAEIDQYGLVVPFTHRWSSTQDARAWAAERLSGCTTIAVDGSHVPPSKEFGVPAALIQVAWFENPHDADRPYVKDVYNEIVTLSDDGSEGEGYLFAESRVAQQRFALEMRTAVERSRDAAGDPPPVVLVDGSFILSFVGRMAPEARQVYFTALFGLLEASRHYRVPVIGYVDFSVASDLATMLRTAFDLPDGRVFDAHMLESRMAPLDRTAAFLCARGDVLPQYRTDDRDLTEDLYFVYLKTGNERPPARVDFPGWVLDAGLLDHVMDVLRAEIVVGSGYPYALETADAAAVLTVPDRLAFYRMFHDFAKDAGFDTPMPLKSVSKGHRR